MTGSRLYDAARVAQATRAVLKKSYQLTASDFKQSLEGSSVLRSIYQKSSIVKIGLRVAGCDLFTQKIPRERASYTESSHQDSSAFRGIPGTPFELSKRPTIAQHQHQSGNVNGTREYSTKKKEEKVRKWVFCTTFFVIYFWQTNEQN